MNTSLLYFLIASVLLIVAAIADLRTREIPDWIPLALVGLACVAAALGWAGVKVWMVVSGAVVGLIIGSVLFQFAKFGGGDAKLIIALGSLVGPVGLMIVLFWMAIAGGVLALIAMYRGQNDYAYAPAIAAGWIVGSLKWEV